MNYNVFAYAKNTELSNTDKSILAELLLEKPRVDITYTDEAGEWIYAVSPKKEKFEDWWLGCFDTLELAHEFTEKFGLEVCNLYDPYNKLG